MYKLYDWLAEKVSTYINDDSSMIDVGAYHGDFTQHLLATRRFNKAHLFEPNPDHYTLLKNKFVTNADIFLYPYALGNQKGSQTFNCSQDDATGSLLAYHPKYHHETAGKKVKSFTVQVAQLDDFYSEHFPCDKIGLIKIDTQGFDLEVLKGAEKIIRDQKPWLVIELNFLSFYASQAPIHSVFNWLKDHGYQLGGFFNDHYSGDKWLAFADGVFVPEGIVDKVREPFTTRIFNDDLVEQNRHLQSVCDERLNLINTISQEADQRLRIINEQTQTINLLTEKLNQMQVKPKKSLFSKLSF